MTSSDHSFAPDALALPNTDDTVAARAWAAAILDDACAPLALAGPARLILTAAVLHLHARIGPEPTVDELHGLLRELSVCPAVRRAFAASPIHLVRYAAAELAESPGAALTALTWAVQALTKARK